MRMISIEEFRKIELRVGRVVSAEPVVGSQKLLKLKVDIGFEERQVIAGISQHYNRETLVGRMIVVVANLEPRMLMGVLSQSMVLAASYGEEVALLEPDLAKEIKPGSIIK